MIDNTNPLPGDRARYIGEARRAGFRVVAYFFDTPLGDAIRRNNQRTGKQKIPIPAIAGTLRKLRAPMVEEGYDAIYRVTISPEGGFVVSRDGGYGTSAAEQSNRT